ncbi:hypothetical protein BDV59DRAFT_149449 [Aspergillus ambiguus]|uniref:uncharacterized protein n=1 Tax=Aspergillus ambiguus TaxID=176160 RepID=UPI003CCD3E75
MGRNERDQPREESGMRRRQKERTKENEGVTTTERSTWDEKKRRPEATEQQRQRDNARLHRPSGSILSVSPPLLLPLRLSLPSLPLSSSLHVVRFPLLGDRLWLSSINPSIRLIVLRILNQESSCWARFLVRLQARFVLNHLAWFQPHRLRGPSSTHSTINRLISSFLFSLMATHPLSLPLFISLCALRLPSPDSVLLIATDPHLVLSDRRWPSF